MVVIFNFIGVIIIFPAMIAIDVKRRKDQRYDIICCVKGLDAVSCLSYSVYPFINKPSSAQKKSQRLFKIVCRF